jgi:hypothetical protein
MAAAIGNQYAAKSKQWALAIEQALQTRSKAAGRAALNDLAEVLLTKAAEGDMAALKELGDRLDGKAAQSVEVTGDAANPLSITISATDAKL